MIAAPKLWNMLLADARDACTMDNFKTLVKTFLVKNGNREGNEKETL